MRRYSRHFPAFLLIALLVYPAAATATTIQFLVTDTADSVPGEDLWRYTYYVDGFTFDTDFGFSVFFDYMLYATIESPPPVVNADWDVISIQPDSNLPDDGFYDALALVDGASLTDPFTVSFVWLGEGSPDSQPFVVYQPGFSTIESGHTVVPEPSTILLLAGAVAVLAGRKKKDKIVRSH